MKTIAELQEYYKQFEKKEAISVTGFFDIAPATYQAADGAGKMRLVSEEYNKIFNAINASTLIQKEKGELLTMLTQLRNDALSRARAEVEEKETEKQEEEKEAEIEDKEEKEKQASVVEEQKEKKQEETKKTEEVHLSSRGEKPRSFYEGEMRNLSSASLASLRRRAEVANYAKKTATAGDLDRYTFKNHYARQERSIPVWSEYLSRKAIKAGVLSRSDIEKRRKQAVKESPNIEKLIGERDKLETQVKQELNVKKRRRLAKKLEKQDSLIERLETRSLFSAQEAMELSEKLNDKYRASHRGEVLTRRGAKGVAITKRAKVTRDEYNALKFRQKVYQAWHAVVDFKADGHPEEKTFIEDMEGKYQAIIDQMDAVGTQTSLDDVKKALKALEAKANKPYDPGRLEMRLKDSLKLMIQGKGVTTQFQKDIQHASPAMLQRLYQDPDVKMEEKHFSTLLIKFGKKAQKVLGHTLRCKEALQEMHGKQDMSSSATKMGITTQFIDDLRQVPLASLEGMLRDDGMDEDRFLGLIIDNGTQKQQSMAHGLRLQKTLKADGFDPQKVPEEMAVDLRQMPKSGLESMRAEVQRGTIKMSDSQFLNFVMRKGTPQQQTSMRVDYVRDALQSKTFNFQKPDGYFLDQFEKLSSSDVKKMWQDVKTGKLPIKPSDFHLLVSQEGSRSQQRMMTKEWIKVEKEERAQLQQEVDEKRAQFKEKADDIKMQQMGADDPKGMTPTVSAGS